MPGFMNRTREPAYAGPAFVISPPASALPKPKRFLQSLKGSGARRNGEGPGDGDEEAVAVPSDKSHEVKKAVSETEEQDGAVDAKPEATPTASHQENTACEDQTQRTNDNDEDNGINRQPVSNEEDRTQRTNDNDEDDGINKQPVSEEEELQRRQQVIIDSFEAQTTPIQAAPPPPTTTAPRDHQRFTIPANVQRAAQAMQLGWQEQQIQTTGQIAAEWLAAWNQSTNELLRVCRRRLDLNLARVQELKLWKRWDEINKEIERGRIPAEANEGLRRAGDGNSNGINENGTAGIEGESDPVASPRLTTIQESEETTGGNDTVPLEDTNDGQEAEEGAECLTETRGIDDECFCCTM